MTKNKKTFVIVSIITVIVIISIVIIGHLFQTKVINNATQYVNALNDSVNIWKDKYNQEHAKIQVIETYSKEQFLKTQIQDSTIQELQQLVNNYKRKGLKSASIIKTEVVIDTIFVSERDSDTYYTNVNLNGWIYGKIKAMSDSTFLDLKIKNEFSILQGTEGYGKNRRPYIEIINHNPYSETKSIRSYQENKQLRSKNFSIGPQIGYGFTSVGQPHLYIGIGIQYNIISF